MATQGQVFGAPQVSSSSPLTTNHLWLGVAGIATDSAASAVNTALGVTTVGTATVGQIPGTTTNDAATAGNVGEYRFSKGTAGTSTVTITNATPGVVSWTAHGLNTASPVNFTTVGGGTLPSQLVAGTNYFVCTVLTANTFTVATSVDNAIAGTAITTSGGSGTVTAQAFAIMANNTVINITGMSLTAGDWDVSMLAQFTIGGIFTGGITSISTTSATQDTSVGHFASIPYPATSNPSGSFDLSVTVPPLRISLASTTTIYFTLKVLFSTSTVNGYGIAQARRAR